MRIEQCANRLDGDRAISAGFEGPADRFHLLRHLDMRQIVGNAVGASMSGWLLGAIGYTAHAAQGETVLRGMMAIFAGGGVAAALLGLVVLRFYRLRRGWQEARGWA